MVRDVTKRARRGAVLAVLCTTLAITGITGTADATERGAETLLEQPARALQPAVRIAPPPPPVAPLPAEAQPVDTTRPDRVIGTGSAASCTSAAVVDAVALGGVITFDCGPDPVTITMTDTAKVVNTSRVVVLDGGGTVTLSGAGRHRILYMNTCDRAQVWTTPHCQNQDHPSLTVQGLAFSDGNSTGEIAEGGGGGAVFVRGGRVKIVDSTFTNNRCDPVGPDVGGGAVRVLSQFDGLPVVVANTAFTGNSCSNGGATSSIGVSWKFYASTFTGNTAIGNGANPQRPGTPGGGNGGAIYLDGGLMTLDLFDTVVTDNRANEGGSGIFFVSNDRTGQLRITDSTLERNPRVGFETAGFPGIFHLGSGPPQITNSTIR